MKVNLSITEFKNPSGQIVFRVTGKDKDGLRVRENFKTQEEATGRKQVLENEILNLPSTPLQSTKLTGEQLAMAEHAFAELKDFRLSLLDAVKWTKANWTDPEKKITVTDAFDKFIAAKTAANKRPAYLRTVKQRVGRLSNTIGETLVSDVQPDVLKGILFREGSGLVNQESDYRAFTNFFNWAIKHSYCAVSPMSKIEKIELDEKTPQILSLQQVRKLVYTAAEYKEGVTLPYLILALFCAIRPAEIERLTWDDVDIKAAIVDIAGENAKGRARRSVEISKNAMKFLLPHVTKKPPFVGVNWRRDFDAVKELSGVDVWIPDVLRHTGISHHLKKHANEGKTAEWAGNSPAVIHRRYKASKLRAGDVRAFWSIMPSDVSRKILKMAV